MADPHGSNVALVREALEAAMSYGPWLPDLQFAIRRAGGPEAVLAAALEELRESRAAGSLDSGSESATLSGVQKS